MFIDQIPHEENYQTPTNKNKHLNNETNNNLTNVKTQNVEKIKDDNKPNPKIKTLYIRELESISDSSINSSNINQSLASQEKNFNQKITANKTNFNSQVLSNEKINFNMVKKDNILLKEENKILKGKIQILNESIQYNQKQIKKITKINKDYEIRIDKLNKEILALNKKLDEKETIISDYENTIQKINELILKDKNILVEKEKLVSDLNTNYNIENKLELKSNQLSENFETNKNFNLQNLTNYCNRSHNNSQPKNRIKKINSSEVIYDIKRYNKNKRSNNISINNLNSNYIFKNYFSNNTSNNSRNKIVHENRDITFPIFQTINLDNTLYNKNGTSPIPRELTISNSNMIQYRTKNWFDFDRSNNVVTNTETIEKKDSKKNIKTKQIFFKNKTNEKNKSSNNNKYSNLKKLQKLYGSNKVTLTSNTSRVYNFEKEKLVISNLIDMKKNGIKKQEKLSQGKSSNIPVLNDNKNKKPKKLKK